MDILVIGGTYFLGKAFVEQAKEEDRLTLLNRGSRRANGTGMAQITEFVADRHDMERVALLKDQRFDVVVDFCAYQEEDIRSILDALEGKTEQYIYISTCDVYRRGTGKVQEENGELEERDFGGEAGAYILGKAALERELEESCRKWNVHGTSVRPAFIYGPGNYAPRESIFFQWIADAGQVLVPQDEDGSFQMVYVKDLAKVIRFLCGNPQAYGEAFNVCGEQAWTYRFLVDTLRKATGAEIENVELSVREIEERGILMPFPLRKEESEQYSDEKLRRILPVNLSFTSAEKGMKEAFEDFRADLFDMDGVFAEVDRLFEENQPGEAKALLLNLQKQARHCADKSAELQVLNELIGYYRQTSEKEELRRVIDQALELTEKLGLGDSIPYATTALNAANACRSIRDLETSEKLYGKAKAIYDAKLPEDHMLAAGLYNNMSLLYQELGDFEKAEKLLLSALEIAKKNQAGFEIAVTYSNLANTAILAKDYTRSKEYAMEAIHRFQERNVKDAHYCAALSALGNAYYEEGRYNEAKALFLEGMEIVEKSLGHNLQYERLKNNWDICREKLGEISEHTEKKIEKAIKKEKQEPSRDHGMNAEKARKECIMTEKVNGMTLCRKYYETFGIPMLQEHFPEYEGQIATGLVGEGSDCFGFDDELSRDHDWGPDFCIWVTDDIYSQIGKELEMQYEALPDQFMGYQRTRSTQGMGRRGIGTVSGFYRRILGYTKYEEIDWHSVTDEQLSTAVNGQVFRDDAGIFTGFREKLLQGYPAGIRCLKLAEDVANFSQNMQYNYFRMRERGDFITADMLMLQGMKYAMKLLHHWQNVYPPHDKWLFQSTRRLPGGRELTDLLKEIHKTMEELAAEAKALQSEEDYSEKTGKIKELTDQVGEFLAMRLYESNDISDIDPYLDSHTEELLKRAKMEDMDEKELVDRIVKLEFEAFDKVKNEGGRAYCQNDWPTFSIMRKSQYMTWNRAMLMQYLYDFSRELNNGHNLITEKYGRMMESTAPDRYAELKEHFPDISPQKKNIIEQIVEIQMQMMEAFAEEYPNVAQNARRLHTYEDEIWDTSYETYLRGEISTYSDKMLQLYGQYVAGCASTGINIARKTIENTVELYGYHSIEELSQKML